jgi:two-component system CheB/CheR fusion protein
LNRARKALKETEALSRLAVVVRDASDAILMVDNAGQILAWNPAAERMYGWSEARAITMNIRDITPESQREQALEKARQMARARTLKPYSTQRVTQDKKLLKVWVTATALVNETGEVYAISTTEREADPLKPGN